MEGQGFPNLPVISTTVLSWNRGDLLKRTLESYRATVSVPCEMHIVDNGSTDHSREVIQQFCEETPFAKPIFLDDNKGGEAINLGLEVAVGNLLHISENDIEYLPGWCQRTVDYFSCFKQLGQLALFGPVPTDAEAWEVKPSVLRHAAGHILYEAMGNVSTTSVIRREVWEKGVRVKSLPTIDGFRFPADATLSSDVKNAGFMVAWSDHYLVNNLGHAINEFQLRGGYYRKNYQAKPWLGVAGLEKRMSDWQMRPKPRRSSFLFPGKAMSGEKTSASSECPQPQLWSMLDGWTAEVETLEFLYGLIRLVKPVRVVETGTWHGYGAEAIGRAMKDNGFGQLVTLELDKENHEFATRHLHEAGLESIVSVIHESSLNYLPTEPIDCLLLDSSLEIRAAEFRHFLPYLRPETVILFHDTSSVHEVVREQIRQLESEDLIRSLSFSTPRGVTICRLAHVGGG